MVTFDGASVEIGANAVIYGPCFIGEGTKISSGVIIGEPAESRVGSHTGITHPIVIGKNVVIREHTVIQRGLVRNTEIMDDAYVMHGCHIAHDCIVGRGATLSPYAVMGGHSKVMNKATMGIHSSIHQWCLVGPWAMLAMGAVAIRDVPPGVTVAGVPAKIIGMNTRGLEEHRVTDQDLEGARSGFERQSVRGWIEWDSKKSV